MMVLSLFKGDSVYSKTYWQKGRDNVTCSGGADSYLY